MRIRYIRNSLCGSNVNNGCQWIEIRAFDYFGDNIALNKSVIASFEPSVGNLNMLTNDIVSNSSTEYVGYKNDDNKTQYVQIDLNALHNIKNIDMYHFNDDRVYKGNKLEVSKNGIDWVTVFDSDIEGGYPSNLKGKSIKLNIVEQIGNIPASSNLTFTKCTYKKILDIKNDEKLHLVDLLKSKGIDVSSTDKTTELLDRISNENLTNFVAKIGVDYYNFSLYSKPTGSYQTPNTAKHCFDIPIMLDGQFRIFCGGFDTNSSGHINMSLSVIRESTVVKTYDITSFSSYHTVTLDTDDFTFKKGDVIQWYISSPYSHSYITLKNITVGFNL